MGVEEPEVSRLLRGDVPNDDPVWGDVSGFLDRVASEYPTVPTTPIEGRHLAAVARESRLVHAELRHPRQGAVKRLFGGTHRILAGSVGAFLILLTVGAGVASAFGINPLEQLMARLPVSSPVAPSATTPTTGGTDEPAGGRKDGSAPGASPGATTSEPGEPTKVDATGKQTEKAGKDAAKALKEAEKAAAKAKKEAEKAAEKAKPQPQPQPQPSPGKGSGKKGDAGGEKSGETGGQEP